MVGFAGKQDWLAHGLTFEGHAMLDGDGTAGVEGVLITRSDGTLLGLLERAVAERALQEADDADR